MPVFKVEYRHPKTGKLRAARTVADTAEQAKADSEKSLQLPIEKVTQLTG